MVESGGILPAPLDRFLNAWPTTWNKKMKIKSDIKAATRYPKIVVIALLSALFSPSLLSFRNLWDFKSTKLELPCLPRS